MEIVFSSMKTVLFISLQIVPQRTGINDEDEEKQGRIHGRTVADGLAGAVMQKTARNLKRLRDRPTDLPTYRPTRQGVESRVRD